MWFQKHARTRACGWGLCQETALGPFRDDCGFCPRFTSFSCGRWELLGTLGGDGEGLPSYHQSWGPAQRKGPRWGGVDEDLLAGDLSVSSSLPRSLLYLCALQVL